MTKSLSFGKFNISIFALFTLILPVVFCFDLYFLILLSAILIHEASHIAAMKIVGCEFDAISIYPFGIDIECNFDKISYKNEFFIHISGGFANILMCLFCLWICTFRYSRELLFFAFSNAFFGITNLLPLSNFDGGHSLFCLLCLFLNLDTAQKICRIISDISRFLLVLASFFLLSFTSCNFSFVITLCYIALCSFLSEKLIESHSLQLK